MKDFSRQLTAVFIFFLLKTSFATCYPLPENHSVNGGLTIIPIDVNQKPEAYYDNKKIAILPSSHPGQWLLVVGIPLDKTQSIQKLLMTKPLKTAIPFHVSNKFYPTQYLTIRDNRKVDPYEKDKQRIDKETQEMAALFASYTPANPFAEGFQAPAHGPISSLFGLKRVYNKKNRPPHSGLDIAAPARTPVKVISRGKVVSTKDYFFTGNTVIVDHGMGVFSLYAHLDRIDVKKGDELQQGAQVGLVGQTGRATGPHLHWSIIMNQTLIDPLLFVPVRVITAAPVKKPAQTIKPAA